MTMGSKGWLGAAAARDGTLCTKKLSPLYSHMGIGSQFRPIASVDRGIAATTWAQAGVAPSSLIRGTKSMVITTMVFKSYFPV
jgi:hypothetical protein